MFNLFKKKKPVEKVNNSVIENGITPSIKLKNIVNENRLKSHLRYIDDSPHCICPLKQVFFQSTFYDVAINVVNDNYVNICCQFDCESQNIKCIDLYVMDVNCTEISSMEDIRNKLSSIVKAIYIDLKNGSPRRVYTV